MIGIQMNQPHAVMRIKQISILSISNIFVVGDAAVSACESTELIGSTDVIVDADAVIGEKLRFADVCPVIYISSAQLAEGRVKR